MQTTHHAGKIRCYSAEFCTENCGPANLLLSRKVVSHRLPVQHILWSGRRRANCYWTHCMHGGENATLSKKSRLGEWFSCVLNQWGALCYYSVDGQAEADIMPRKKALCAICLRNKTLCFFDGERSALLYGLIGICLLNDIDPEAYLRHIPERTAGITFQPY